MRILNGTLAGLATLLITSAATAALTVAASTAVTPTAVPLGTTFTIDITVSTSGNEALALGLRAADYDPAILGSGTATIVPTSIFNFSPQVPVGGLANTTTGGEQPPLEGVRADWSINLFQGVATSPAAGAGPDTFQVQFTAATEGTTTVNFGAFAAYSDTYTGGDNMQTTDSITFTVVPEPASVASALAALGTVAGVVTVRRRR